MWKRLLLSSVVVPALSGCRTDPSTVDLTGSWLFVAHVHAADLREDQQSCTVRHGLIITSDSATTSVGQVRGLYAEGDTTGRIQCVLYGETRSPAPAFRGHFVVTHSGEHIAVYQSVTGLLAYNGSLKGPDRMDGRVGIDVLGVGTWIAYRR